MSTHNFGIAIHGGAGTILKSEMTTEKENNYKAALDKALQAGYDCLLAGKSSLLAVEAAIIELENSPLFNAGRGAVFNAKGQHEMDASIMDGNTLHAGAVAAVRNLKNPISLATKVLHHSDHILLMGEG
ncbi:MAG: beta-aspartyl-peptidase (threonine type), partial [Granulosicoccus sp.]